MNLEASHQLPITDQANVSASGNSYWQAQEPQVTVLDRAAQAATVTHKVVTHKFVIISVVVLAASVLSLGIYSQIAHMQKKAKQAEIERTSRVVVL